ncbi:MAG: PD-(D/E)XK nuclease family protein, partial [Deltaproteobacteria bacterium]|nr:PD-(D/E)XK nuclease family protein [Deltaproteobacteria bacterium]
VSAPASAVASRRVSCASSEEEFHAAASWALARLAQRTTSRVALVVPRLAEHRERILAVLEDVFEPGSVLPGMRPRGGFYNVSLGQPLAAIPMVYDAILWWRLAAGEALEIDTLSYLLRSPFTGGGQDERVARALFDLTLRDRGRPAMTLASTREFLAHRLDRKNSKASVPVRWSAALDRLGDVAAALAVDHLDAGASSRRAAEHWPEVLRKILAAVGWPGDRSLDSDEHQEFDALGGALRDLAGLDLTRPEGFDYPEILHWVTRILEETLFQPESRSEAPVQVLGQLEAVGQPFDHAWIAGLDEAHWPVSGEPNSFLPLALQRAHAMPHASPAVDLARARRLTATLLALAGDAVVSVPLREGDLLRGPSPLIASLPEVAEDELGLGDLVPLVDAFAVGTFESFIDDQGPAFVPSGLVRGGSSLFADQAACPFRAFARHRLVASAPETPEAGVTAATYGSLVHRALEDLFGILKSHADLVACSEAELRAVAQDAAGRAIESWRQRLPDVFSPRLTRLLHGRLSALLSEWLALERDRLPFRVVARERKMIVTAGGLTCDLRVDRVDALDDGSLVILDYKTGQGASHRDWLRDRLG